MDIQELRKEIDRVDDQLTALFVQRMELAAEVAAYKQNHAAAVTDGSREQQIFQRVCAASGETFAPYTERLFQLLIAMSKEYQRSLLQREE